MKQFKGKKALIVGVGKTGLALIHFFNEHKCKIRVTDIKPIFDLNKAIKKLKRIDPVPEMTFGEHREEDFLDADIIVYSKSVNPNLPQLEKAREAGKEVHSEFSLGNMLCNKPIIVVCGYQGRSSIAHMVGFILKLEGKNVFVGGGQRPFIEYFSLPDKESIDYVVVELSVTQTCKLKNFHPKLVVISNVDKNYTNGLFGSNEEYLKVKFSVIDTLSRDSHLICNLDSLEGMPQLENVPCPTFWYSRRSFVKLKKTDIKGTHFHEKRIHSNIHSNSEFRVLKMRIVGVENRENLLAAITTAKVLNVSDKSIQECIERFPGIPHSLEFLMEKNGVRFYNDSKCETMPRLVQSLNSFKEKHIILIAGGKNVEDVEFSPYAEDIIKRTRMLILVGECKERLNRVLGKHSQTYIVGSFEESVLLAYQKSRTGDIILLSPGNPGTDFFRDYIERGNYFKKLVYQL